MNAEIDTIQQKVFTWVETAAQQVGDFASREIPPFIHEYLLWKFWENFVPVLFYLFVFIFIIALYKKLMMPLWKWCYKQDFNSDGTFGYSTTWLAIPTIITIIVGLIMFFNFPYSKAVTCLQIKIAPKVYLVEKAAEIIKDTKK